MDPPANLKDLPKLQQEKQKLNDEMSVEMSVDTQDNVDEPLPLTEDMEESAVDSEFDFAIRAESKQEGESEQNATEAVMQGQKSTLQTEVQENAIQASSKTHKPLPVGRTASKTRAPRTVGTGKFRCNVCQRRMSSAQNLAFHQERKHGISRPVRERKRMKCAVPACEHVCSNLNQLITHLNETHSLSLSFEYLDFETEAEFDAWLTRVQQEVPGSYQKRSETGPRKDRAYFYCTRSSLRRGSQNAGRVDLRRQTKHGLSKIIRTCPAHVVMHRAMDGRVLVKHVGQHLCQTDGDVEEHVKHLSVAQRKWITERLLMGISKDDILKELEKGYIVEERAKEGDEEGEHGPRVTHADLLNIELALSMRTPIKSEAEEGGFRPKRGRRAERAIRTLLPGGMGSSLDPAATKLLAELSAASIQVKQEAAKMLLTTSSLGTPSPTITLLSTGPGTGSNSNQQTITVLSCPTTSNPLGSQQTITFVACPPQGPSSAPVSATLQAPPVQSSTCPPSASLHTNRQSAKLLSAEVALLVDSVTSNDQMVYIVDCLRSVKASLESTTTQLSSTAALPGGQVSWPTTRKSSGGGDAGKLLGSQQQQQGDTAQVLLLNSPAQPFHNVQLNKESSQQPFGDTERISSATGLQAATAAGASQLLSQTALEALNKLSGANVAILPASPGSRLNPSCSAAILVTSPNCSLLGAQAHTGQGARTNKDGNKSSLRQLLPRV